MRLDMTRSERKAACLDEMKSVTPSRATVENAIARARAHRQASKKKPTKTTTSRSVVKPFAMKKNLSTLEPDPSTRSVDWEPEPSATKNPSSPTQEFFQNVFASRSTASPTHGSRGRGSGHNSRAMADPPSSSDPPSSDPPSVDAPALVVAATNSEDEEREDGDTVDAAPRQIQGRGEATETPQTEILDLQSVEETQECDFGLERRNLPNPPSMKSDKGEEQKEDDWELKGMSSEETMKATGNARRTRPHKGIFVRKGKKKNADDDEDGKVIRSLFSVDSSVAPVNALFDQESCFNDDEDEDDFDDDVSEEQPRKADPPDSSRIEVTESDSETETAAASSAKEEMEESSDIKEAEVPWDKKGTSLGHVEMLVASIKAKKAQEKSQPFTKKSEDTTTKEVATVKAKKAQEKPPPLTKRSEDTSTKESASAKAKRAQEKPRPLTKKSEDTPGKEVDSIKAKKAQEKPSPLTKMSEDTSTKEVSTIKAKTAQVKPRPLAKKSEDTSTKEATDSDTSKQGEENEEYEDFVGDFLQSGSGDDAPQAVEGEAETNAEVVEGAIGEAENDNLIVDEVEKCSSQNAFLEQFEALGIEEESPQKKRALEEKEADETLNKSLDAITEWRMNELKVLNTNNDTKKEETKQEEETSQDQQCLTEKDGEQEREVQNVKAEQEKIDSSTTSEKEQPPVGETTIGLTAKAEVATLFSADSVESNDGNTHQETTNQGEKEKIVLTGSANDDDTASSTSEENQTMKEQQESEVPKEEIPEEPIHIFKFAKRITEDDWQEKNEMASEWQFKTSSIHLDGVAAAENIHRFTNLLNREPEPRPWKVTYEQRTRNHPGFKKIDICSVLDSTKVTVSGKPRDDYIPWEHRDVKQLFLQERSVEFSRNWYGENQYHRVNARFKLPVCRPRSMEMPIGTTEDAVEWNKDVYTTWKSPYQKIEHQRLKLNKSEDNGDKSNGSESKEKEDEGRKQSHLAKKSASRDGHEEGSQDSEYDDEGSYSDGSYSDGSYTDSEGSYDDDEESFDGSVASETGSAIIIDDNNTVASWEEAPECGNIVNMKLKIGEHVTRVHPEYTSSLRRSRWRKKYFPKGSFPY